MHDEPTGAVPDRSFEWTSDEGVSCPLIDAIAEQTSVEPIDLDPLYSVIDPDALDALFQDSNSVGSVSFDYEGYLIVIEARGRGYLYDVSDAKPVPVAAEVFEN